MKLNDKDYEKIKKLGLEWYVLMHDFNKNEITRFNIFNSSNMLYGVSKELKNYTTYENFKKEIDGWLKYAFWSKSEYEITVGGLFIKDFEELEKIDIYYQVEKNLDTICKYILTKYNATKRKKLEF